MHPADSSHLRAAAWFKPSTHSQAGATGGMGHLLWLPASSGVTAWLDLGMRCDTTAHGALLRSAYYRPFLRHCGRCERRCRTMRFIGVMSIPPSSASISQRMRLVTGTGTRSCSILSISKRHRYLLQHGAERQRAEELRCALTAVRRRTLNSCRTYRLSP